MRVAPAAAGLLALLALLACDLPRDPERTLERVRARGIRAGLADAPPWAMRRAGAPAGIEVELLEELARRLGTHVVWHQGGLEAHLAALHHRELDVVAGGLTSDTPWKKRVGLTRPYYSEELRLGVAPGTPPPTSLAGVRVAVRAGSAEAHLVRARDAVPWRARSPRGHPLVAAAAWELAAWGYRPFGEPLHRREHVLAVAPGENRWLLRVEEALAGREQRVRRRLEELAKP
jgi:polar amino acid transport system substrate-binding protein